MSRSAFLNWWAFYELHPFDDRSRFYRPAALIAGAMRPAIDGAVDVSDLIGWLEGKAAPAKAPSSTFEYSAADLATFKAFGVKPPGKQ